MKRMKRLVALLVTIATLASLCAFSVPVSAEELPVIEVSAEDELLIEKLEALGVIDVKYNAASYVTRRQMAEIIVKYMNLTITASEAETPFRDVKTSDPAYVQIRTLYDMGIVTGDFEKRFNPDNYLTYDEALVFIINAIGYKMFAVREGGYPTGYYRVAISHGMLKNLSMKLGSDPVKLTDVYKMLEAALTSASIEEVYYGSGDVSYTFSDTETFLSETYGIRKYRGCVTGNEYTRLDNAKATLTDEQIEIKDGDITKVYDTPGYIYGYMLGHTVDYYLTDDIKKDSELKYIEEAGKLNRKIRIDADDLLVSETAASSGRIYYEDEDDDEQHITFAKKSYYIYNNQCGNFTSFADVLPKNGYIEALDNNADGKYDVLFVYEYESYYVEAADIYDNIITVNDGVTTSTIDLSKRKEKYAIYLAGLTDLKDINAIAAGSVISVMKSAGATPVRTIYVSNKSVSGKITEYDSDKGYLIGEESFKIHNDDKLKLSLGNTGVFYIDMNNEIVYSTYDASSDKSVVGIMTGFEKGKSRKDPKVTVRLYTATGEFLVTTLAEKVKLDGGDDKISAYNGRKDLTKDADVDDVIKWITHGDGEITKLYPIKYVINSENIITSMEQARPKSEAGDGVFSVLESKVQRMVVRYGGMVSVHPEGGDYFYPNVYHYNASTTLSFIIPPDATKDENGVYKTDDFSDISKYAISKSLAETDHRDMGESYYSMYSFGTEATSRIDLMIFKSAPKGATLSSDSMAVVKKITDFANEDGEVVKKLYLNENTEVILDSKIRVLKPYSLYVAGSGDYTEKGYYTGGHTLKETTMTLEDVLKEGILSPGSVIFYGKNEKQLVDSIRVVARYDESELNPDLKLKPMFRIKDDQVTYLDTYYFLNGPMHHINEATIEAGAKSTEKNAVIGVITSVGKTPGMITFRLPQYIKYDSSKKEYVEYEGSEQLIKIMSNGSYNLYNSEDNTVEHLTLARFREGDIFIASVDRYHELKTIIVFR